jgi:hypothetical protein
MTTAQILGMTDVSWRARWQRGRVRLKRTRRVIISVIAVLLAIGAFLMWGPIGLGNGPLYSGHGYLTTGWPDSSQGPVAITFPLVNSGRDRPVIDAVEFLSPTRYAAPRVLGLEVETWALPCTSVGPARPAGHAFVSDGCGRSDRGPLIGRSIGALSQGLLGAAEIAAPRPGWCWTITRIVVHYHVGIRHYAATDPYALAVCGKDAAGHVDAAMNAADGSAA